MGEGAGGGGVSRISGKKQAEIASAVYELLTDKLREAGADAEDLLITTCAVVTGVTAGVGGGQHRLLVLGEIMNHLRKTALEGMAVVTEGPETMQ